MKERPIIFSGEMVKAILAGSKTQTRRVIKIQGVNIHDKKWVNARYYAKGNCWFFNDGILETWSVECPYGQVGDRLWVRETTYKRTDGIWLYKADDEWIPRSMNYYKRDVCPSIFMPRWASRITLEITEVRVERLQEITEEDARLEGFKKGQTVHLDGGGMSWPQSAKGVFHLTWDSLNDKRGYGWEVNPWVWVIEFKVLDT